MNVKELLTDGIYYKDGTNEFILMISGSWLEVSLNCYISFVCLTGNFT